MENIYLVIENGSGDIHLAFKSEEKAKEHITELEQSTGLFCYEVLEIELKS
jgi:hypothetical protein